MKRIVCIFAIFFAFSLACVLFTSCKNSKCEHEYANKWSNDSENHWKTAICEHTTEIAYLAPHTDTDKNGKCDVCGYALPDDNGVSGEDDNTDNVSDDNGHMDSNWDTDFN